MDGMWVYNGRNMGGISIIWVGYGWIMDRIWVEYGWNMGVIWVILVGYVGIWVEWSGQNDQYRKLWKI